MHVTSTDKPRLLCRDRVLYHMQYNVGGVCGSFVNSWFCWCLRKETKSTQKQQKLICESNQSLEFYRRSSLGVVLINPVPRVFQCPFSMPHCAGAVFGSEVDLCCVPAEICARFGVTQMPFYIPNCQFRKKKSDNLLETNVVNSTISFNLFIRLYLTL